MKRLFIIILMFLVPMISGFTLPGNIVMNYPQNGQSVRGLVEITGTVVSDLFFRGEVYYAYNNSENTTWFLISTLEQPIENGVLARWDTTTITDGEYQLKIKLIKTDSSSDELIIQPVFVRNYSIEPTVTPEPTNVTVLAEEDTPITPINTYSTPFPPNPAAVSSEGIKTSITIGIIVILLVLTGLLVYEYINRHRQFK